MNRRTLFLAVAVVLVGALALFFRAGTGSSKSATPVPRATAVKPTAHPRPVLRPASVPLSVLTERRYADRLLPVVARAARVFNTVARAAQTKSSLGPLAQVCAASIKGIGVQEDYVDGVPHPYAWYTRSGLLHQDILGIYHKMIGATENCQITASNDDQTGADIAVSDMRHAASQLDRVVGHLKKLSSQSHPGFE